MDISEVPRDKKHDRRRFLGAASAAALAAGATQLGVIGSAKAQAGGADSAGRSPAGLAAASTSFGPVKQVNAGVLNVGYVDAGPADGRPVILLHGFPYDIHSFVEVAPLLAAQGYRVIVPYMRGHGTTTFLSSQTRRDAQQSVMALDVLALMDALKIEKAVLAGYDLGSRSAAPAIAVPTITVDGKYDPFTPPGDGAAYRAHFTGKYDHRTFDVGHNVPQEAPQAFAQAVADVDRF
jgi:pimeloyl-ACP methyl ester carboxylesterase